MNSSNTEQHSQKQDLESRHCHYQKKWMVYNKDDVVEKLNESLDSILKYFNSCFQTQNKNLVENLHMNDYMASRVQNIHNLCAILLNNGELDYVEFL